MPKTLPQYIDWLHDRDDIWPAPPKPVPAKATPYLKPLEGIRAVTWDVYGTLLRISDGRLLFLHPQQLRMQVALEKTIHEFNMWQSMSRKPGQPWEYMLEQYKTVLEEQQMAGTKHKGDFPEIDSAALWRKLLGRLEQKEYQYDEAFYGDMDELSEKVAYYFHARLQGVEAAPNALAALSAVAGAGLKQGLLADGQPFTLPQLLRALRGQGTLPPLGDLFDPACVTLSYREGIRKPSKSLYRLCRERFEQLGIAPGEVLHVGARLRDDLAAAKQAGMRTALYAADKTSLQATKDEMRDPALKPDRLLTDLARIRDILSIG
jgi:FMN phosphatase YigB (HAD superfamily)